MDPSNLLDMFLLKASISFHGPQLLEKLQAEQQIDINDLLPDSQTGLLKHQRLNQGILMHLTKEICDCQISKLYIAFKLAVLFLEFYTLYCRTVGNL